ncbi:hypothetical protein VNO77_29016 [Canavalia gladiata]|uniref:Uncharacterized protein n=1 Tax=Canavalia gladiata TaxID=3824 RepID=A0AAN9KW46_CANGL
MGVSSNSKVFLSEKDPKGNNMEIHKEVCPTSIQENRKLITPKKPSVQERDEQEEGDKGYHQEDQKQRNNLIVPKPVLPPLNLKVKIPSHVESEDDDDSNDGFKTPTSSDHKIPVILECPGAPRKIKSKPVMKRKACQRRIAFDLCKELDSLVPTPYAVDLGGGGMNKRVKQLRD